MSAVELGRQRAAELHERALAAGLDPFDPLILALHVAKDLGVGTEDVSPDAPVLQGGQAAFDPAAGTIFYPKTEDRFWAAFLIGHELGHVTLGDAKELDVARDADPTRSAEAAPVGEDRVIDYSRRSRREVQMDLFARELLLPRERVRRYHLQKKMTATLLAKKLGAPYEVIAQQLFDALLLPPIASNNKPTKKRSLNRAQLRAAQHEGGPFALEAGPGTGKTQTLAARVGVLLNRRVDPRNILILTFSNKAAGELADRIAAEAPEAAAAAWIGTFHGFGLDLIKRHYAQLGFNREPTLLDRPQAIELLEAQVSRLGLVHYRDLWDPTENLRAILSAISRAQDEVKGPAEYASCAEITKRRDLEAGEKALEVAGVYERYQTLKRGKQVVDYGDLVTLPITLLKNYPEVRKALQRTYQHILVDEYQDVNRSSVALLEFLISEERNLWVVGDARQAIYRFRGASSFNMARFGREDFAPATRDRLDINYRSRAEIVDGFGDFGTGMAVGEGEGRLQSDRGPCGVMLLHQTVRDRLEEGAGAAHAIQAAHRGGYSYRQQAVLCKGNDRLARIGEDLERRGIPVLFLGSLFERPEIKDLLSWLSLLIDGRAMGLLRYKSPTQLNLCLQDAATVVRVLKESQAAPLAWRDKTLEGLTTEGQTVMAQLRTIFADATSDMQPWAVLTQLLLDKTRWVADIASTDTVAARAQGAAIWQFMNFLRVQPGGQGLPIWRLLNRIRRLVRLADDRELRQLPEAAQSIDAVRLLTIHGSKGLEFDVVHVLGLNQNSLPHTGPSPACPPPDGLIVGADGTGSDFVRDSDAQEQECLFYVALSRARDRLTLHSVRQNAGDRGTARKPSPYLGRIGRLDRVDLDLANQVLLDQDAQPTPVQFIAPFGVTLWQLEGYNRCPRRFLYSYVLDIGGKRERTRFTAVHDVVQQVISQICAGQDANAAQALFDRLWAEADSQPDDFSTDYHQMGSGLVAAFVRSRQGRQALPGTPLVHGVKSGTLHIDLDELLIGDSWRVARLIRTGKRPSQASRIGEEMFLLAASNQALAAEYVYLADGDAPTPLKPGKDHIAKKTAQLSEALAAMSKGLFPMKESERICPSCPAFFICGPLAEGPLNKSLHPGFPNPPS